MEHICHERPRIPSPIYNLQFNMIWRDSLLFKITFLSLVLCFKVPPSVNGELGPPDSRDPDSWALFGAHFLIRFPPCPSSYHLSSSGFPSLPSVIIPPLSSYKKFVFASLTYINMCIYMCTLGVQS